MSTSSDEVTIYHNPRCGKSRAALALLQEKGIEPRVVEYLKTPLRKEALRQLVGQLGIHPEQLVRKGEDVYKQELAGKTLTESQWLEALAAHPILMERPVVVRGKRAVIGRPPEKVLEIL
jgi:arsenate reductase (glutaredoxin)